MPVDMNEREMDEIDSFSDPWTSCKTEEIDLSIGKRQEIKGVYMAKDKGPLKPCKCGCVSMVQLNDVTQWANVYACSECGSLRIATATNMATGD